MNGDATNYFAGITGINHYCTGEWGCMVPLGIREERVRGDSKLGCLDLTWSTHGEVCRGG